MNKRHSFKLLQFLIFCFCGVSVSVDVIHGLKNRVSEAIHECLEEEKIQESIEKEIEQELLRSMTDSLPNRLKKQSKSYLQKKGIYSLPEWPFHALFYKKNDLFHVALTGDFSSQSYSALGRTQNLSQLVFGRCPILIRDILLVSALAEDGLVSGGGHPDAADFAVLAQQPLFFDASTYKIGFSFNYARHFCTNRLSIGLEMPVFFRSNQIRLTNRFKNETQERLTPTEDGGRFKNKTLKQFLIDILDAYGISYKQHNSRTGLGDILLFAHYDFSVKAFEHLIAGFKIVVPTSRGRSFERFWDPELGNGGHVLLGAYISGFSRVCKLFNPHVYTSLQIGCGNSFNMRVSKNVSFDGSDQGRFSTLLPNDCIPLSSNLFLLKDKPFKRLDSCIREFGGNCRRVRITRGPEFFLRIGNVIEHFFFSRGFFDIYYDLLVKGKNYESRQYDKDFDAHTWTKDTDVIAHKFGLDFKYQCNDEVRLGVGGSYIFAGKNVEKTIAIALKLNVEF